MDPAFLRFDANVKRDRQLAGLLVRVDGLACGVGSRGKSFVSGCLHAPRQAVACGFRSFRRSEVNLGNRLRS